MKRLHKAMAKDKDRVVWSEKYWKVDPLSKRGRWSSHKVYGTYLGFDESTKNYILRNDAGETVQRMNFKYMHAAKKRKIKKLFK